MKTQGKPTKYPDPPAHLRPAGAALWRATVRLYDFDQPMLCVLTSMCDAVDRQAEARDILAKEGIVTVNKRGELRAHPACAIERDATATLAKAGKLLGLNLEPTRPSPGARPHVGS
jgi:P27 family predicted phage terminase small subunit